MYIGGMNYTPFLGLLLLLGLSACRVEDTRPQYENNSRLRAVIEAERKRAAALRQESAQQPPSPAAPSPASPQPPPPNAAAAQPPPPGAPAPPAPQAPPSEQGAYVEMTETPAGVPPPPPGTQASGAVDSRGSSARPTGGDAGGREGNVPRGLAPNLPLEGLPPRERAPGKLGPVGPQSPPSSVRGASAAGGEPGGGPAAAEVTSAEDLRRSRAEFERLMRQQGGGSRPAQGAPEGGGGARGAGSGVGRSPDLSGQVGVNPNGAGPGAVRGPLSGDDTIVARQLREAAEREQDPVLKEKLWREYRKYTQP